MPREVFSNGFCQVQYEDSLRVVRITRTALAGTIPVMQSSLQRILEAAVPLRPARALLDLRLAPGNNDAAFEKQSFEAFERLQAAFVAFAILVRSAVGRLQVQRMSRESGQPLHVFFDESEALRFLSEQPLSSHK
jgi:hypothetical protein